jgi:hypothetical protein
MKHRSAVRVCTDAGRFCAVKDTGVFFGSLGINGAICCEFAVMYLYVLKFIGIIVAMIRFWLDVHLKMGRVDFDSEHKGGMR